eukprot:COSAG04_NODE_381_length_15461_cov_843.360370_16_plen_340_part_00
MPRLLVFGEIKVGAPHSSHERAPNFCSKLLTDSLITQMKVPAQVHCSLSEGETVSIGTIGLDDVQHSLDDLTRDSTLNPTEQADANGLNGPALEMLPHGAKFDEPTEVSFDISNLISKAQDETDEQNAVLVVMRQAEEGYPWLPLDPQEELTVDAQGQATMRLRSFSRFSVKLFRGPMAVTDAARMTGKALFEGASWLKKKAEGAAEASVNKIADADASTINTLVKYCAIGVGAAAAGASAACPIAALLLVPVGLKAKAIVEDPSTVQAFAKDLQEKMGDPEDPASGGITRALHTTFKEYAVKKGLDKIRDALEPFLPTDGKVALLECKQPLDARLKQA